MAVNGLAPVGIETFGGLDLRDDPEEIGFNRALDATNVELDPGRVRARYGLSLFSSVAAGSRVDAMAVYSSLSVFDTLIVTNNGTSPTLGVFAIHNDGTLVQASTRTMQIPSIVMIGTPAASYAYVPTGVGGSNGLLRFDGVTWTAPALPAAASDGHPISSAGPLGVSPTDNRLIVGYAGVPDRLLFSDPGAPETFDIANWVDLSPGDGEQIQAIVTWNNQFFVFKQTKFFVFYGNSADATGKPVFNYRTVNTGVGAQGWKSATAGPDGVYFLDRTGVYRTTGSSPVKISTPLDPYFIGTGSPWFANGSTFNPASYVEHGVFWVGGRLYVSAFGSGSTPMFVWDPRLDAWVAWTTSSGAFRFTSAVAMSTANVIAAPRVLMLAGADGKIYRVDPSFTNDAGTAITTGYQSGFSDLGAPAREKTIRETEMVGTGSPQLSWAREFGSPDSAQSVSLGSTVPSRGLDRHARVGELLSYKLSGSGPWSVSRIVPMLRETRGAGEKTS